MAQQQTQLAAAIATTNATTITVDDAYGFPTTGAYSVLIDSEVLRVTAGHTTTTWTVTRGYAGTTAATHLDNAAVTYVPELYAELGALRRATPGILGTAHDLVLLDQLVAAKASTDHDCHRTFLQTPTTGTITVYVDVLYPGYTSLVHAAGAPYTRDGRALDIISVGEVAYRLLGTTTYTVLGAEGTDWELESGYGPGVAGTDWPYEDVSLVHGGSITTWPVGRVRLDDAVLGFPAIPDAVTQGNVAKAREGFRQDIGTGPVQEGVNRFGVPVYASGKPDAYRDLTRPGSVYVKHIPTAATT